MCGGQLCSRQSYRDPAEPPEQSPGCTQGVAFAVEFVGRTIHAHFTEIQGSWSYICSWEGCVDGMAAASILADLDSLSDGVGLQGGRLFHRHLPKAARASLDLGVSRSASGGGLAHSVA